MRTVCMQDYETYTKLIADFSVGFELPIIWTASVTANQPAMLVFYWVLTSDIWVYHGP